MKKDGPLSPLPPLGGGLFFKKMIKNGEKGTHPLTPLL